MPERVKGASKVARPGLTPAVPAPRPEVGQEPPELAADAATLRNRPATPEELLAQMIRRAREAERAAREAAQQKESRDESGETSSTEGLSGASGERPGSEAVEEAGARQPQGERRVPPGGAGGTAQGASGQAASKRGASGQEARIAIGVPGLSAPLAGVGAGFATAADPRGFWGDLWSRTRELATGAWSYLRKGAAAVWKPIKEFGDKIGLTKGLQWLLPKIGDGLKWLQQKLQWAVYGVSFDEFKTRKIEDDPGDVNGPDFSEIQRAKQEIPARARAEKEALDKLSEADRKVYEKLAELTRDRPLSRWALQNMLLDGRLAGGKDLVGQGSVLDHLGRLATRELAEGVKREDLIGDVIAEIENPVRINQQGKGTCVATTAQILLARRNPAEYVRVVSELAAPAGKAKLAGGDTLVREKDWSDDSDYGRSVSSRLIQPALMELGMPLLDYDNVKDKHKAWVIPLSGGLMGFGSAKINEQLLGTGYSSLGFWHWNRNSQWERVKKALEEGKGPLPVGVTWEDLGGHQLQIDKIENGRVYYTNPWGQRESMDEAEFRSHVTNAEIPNGRKVG